jgi:hypothetical protein
LSWLTPILAILIKLDSRGSLFLVKKGTDSILLNLIVTNIDLWKSMSKRIWYKKKHNRTKLVSLCEKQVSMNCLNFLMF